MGVTEERDTGEGLGQGTVEGAIASAVNLDNGVTDFFQFSEDETYYFDLYLRPLLFQDDVARFATSVKSAQSGNDRMYSVAESKLLNFNLEKSGFVLFGSKQRRLEMQTEINETPIKLCGQKMNQFKSVK